MTESLCEFVFIIKCSKVACRQSTKYYYIQNYCLKHVHNNLHFDINLCFSFKYNLFIVNLFDLRCLYKMKCLKIAKKKRIILKTNIKYLLTKKK